MAKVTFLAEGISGKQLSASKKATNVAVKQENTSISFCIKQVLKHDASFLTSFADYKESDITPSNLLKFKKETEGKHGKFTAWLIMTLIRRYYAANTTAVVTATKVTDVVVVVTPKKVSTKKASTKKSK